MYGMFRPSGSLTEGVPAANYGPGTYAFRTSVLYLGMQVLPNSAAMLNAARAVQLQGGSYVAALNASATASFMQPVPMTDRQAIVYYATSLVEAVTIHSGVVGLGLAIAGSLNEVPAQWLTITGTVYAQTGFTLDFLNQALARGIQNGVQLRHPERIDIAVPAPGDSFLLRTRAPDACSGARLYSNVTAAACTRVERTGPPPAYAAQPAPQPGAAIAPWTGAVPTSVPTGGKGGSAPATQNVDPSPLPTIYQPPAAPANDTTPWLLAGGLVLTLGVVAYVALGDD